MTSKLDLPAPALTHLEAAGVHLVGTPAGLYRHADGALTAVPLEGVTFVAALARTPDGALWIGALHDGLFRVANGVAGGVAREVAIEGGPKKKPQTMSLLVTRDHLTLWAGTYEGVCRVDLAASDRARCLTPADGMPAALALGLHEDARGAIWVATYEHGLVRIHDGRAVALGREHGLTMDTFYAVLEDAAERLWLPGPRGIVRVARAELEAVLAGKATRAEVRVFGVGDGMPIDETTGGAMAAYHAASGRMWFATSRGAIAVDPAAPDAVITSPRVVIDELRLGNALVPQVDTAVAADTRELLVAYAAPTLVRPEGVRFRHRLSGVDRDWVDAGARRVAMYSDIPPGEHRFEVEARALGATAWGPAASLSFDFAPRFSETPWFVLVLALAVIALVYAVHRWQVGRRVTRLVAREAELGRLVAARTHELAAAKDEVDALNASLAERVEIAVASQRASERMAAYGHTVAGVAHEVRQPLFALGNTAFTLGARLKDHPELAKQVRLLDRETKRMNRVMDELLDFAKPAGLVLAPTTIGAIVTDAVDAFRAGYDPDGKVPIAVHVPDEVAAIALHADAARLQQVVVNLVANAHRHAVGMTRVRIAAMYDGDGVALIVNDDGGGIPEADLARVFEPFFTTGGTGIGLALARRVVTDHGGTIDVASGPSGVTFTVRLPRGVHGT